jgi:hypothetical protein
MTYFTDKISSDHFMGTLHVNVDNEKISDADFRRFVRNTLPIVEYPRPLAREHSVEIGKCNDG